MKKFLILSMLSLFIISCTGVDSGHKGVEVSWGGKTNQSKIYPEGINYGLNWIWDDMIEYDVREKTFKDRFEFNDSKNMSTGVEVSVDYNLDGSKVNIFHSKIGKENFDIKLHKTIQSAAKEVTTQYTASELNLTKRQEAEQKMDDILTREFPGIYANFVRVQLTDVDIPKAIADAAAATARQEELNKLSASKVQDSKNKLESAEFDAKTNALLSQPAMLQLKKLENERIWAEKGISPWGTNNVFGANAGILINK